MLTPEEGLAIFQIKFVSINKAEYLIHPMPVMDLDTLIGGGHITWQMQTFG